MKPKFWRYYDSYKNGNYGLHCLAFQDADGNIFYYSYNTLVGFYVQRHGTRFIIENNWGTTTGKHLDALEPDKKKRVPAAEFERLYHAAFPETREG